MNYKGFIEERDSLLSILKEKLEQTLLSPDRQAKHEPWTWAGEPTEGHLLKAMRHIQTHMLIQIGEQPDDGEDHLSRAVSRLAMGIATSEASIDDLEEFLTHRS